MTRIVSWNVNGIRAAAKNGMFRWLSEEGPDIFCLQEIKAVPEDLDELFHSPFGYQTHWHSAQKKGYSGVAIFTKRTPLSVQRGIGIAAFDSEGRVLTADYGHFVLINAYFPNSQRDHARLPFKLQFCEAMLKYCDALVKAGKNIILCGDFNIAHQEIDLANPHSNKNNAGFLPEERAWLDAFIKKSGYVDTFRHFCKDPGRYTWWSYRPGVRERNIGWRLDYHFVNQDFLPMVKESLIHDEVCGSDHCPVTVTLKDS